MVAGLCGHQLFKAPVCPPTLGPCRSPQPHPAGPEQGWEKSSVLLPPSTRRSLVQDARAQATQLDSPPGPTPPLHPPLSGLGSDSSPQPLPSRTTPTPGHPPCRPRPLLPSSPGTPSPNLPPHRPHPRLLHGLLSFPRPPPPRLPEDLRPLGLKTPTPVLSGEPCSGLPSSTRALSVLSTDLHPTPSPTGPCGPCPPRGPAPGTIHHQLLLASRE